MSLEHKVLGQELISYFEVLAPLTGGVVAISDNSSQAAAAYSTNGITWTASTMPSVAQWRSVIYGTDKFVAIGYGSSKVAYSFTGTTWSPASLPSSASWQSVTHGDEKFVAIAFYSNKAAYSTDGITWTASTLPSSADWSSVTYGDNKFVAVASSSSATAYSTNGITWVAGSMPSSQQWNAITYGGGKFVVVGSPSSSAAYSADGITWTEVTLPSHEQWRSVSYAENKFVTVSHYTSISAYSTNGITWTASTMPSTSQWSPSARGTVLGPQLSLANKDGGQGSVLGFFPVEVYTVPAGKQVIVTSIFVANQGNNSTNYNFAVVPFGESVSTEHYLRWNTGIGESDFQNISTKITLSEGDSLMLSGTSLGALSISIFGIESNVI